MPNVQEQIKEKKPQRRPSMRDRKSDVTFKEEEHVQKLRHKEEERNQKIQHEDGDRQRQDEQQAREAEQAQAEQEAAEAQEKITGPDYAAMGEQELFGSISPIGMGGQMQMQAQQNAAAQDESARAESNKSSDDNSKTSAINIQPVISRFVQRAPAYMTGTEAIAWAKPRAERYIRLLKSKKNSAIRDVRLLKDKRKRLESGSINKFLDTAPLVLAGGSVGGIAGYNLGDSEARYEMRKRMAKQRRSLKKHASVNDIFLNSFINTVYKILS